MSILRKFQRSHADHREQRAFDRALAAAPTQASRQELELLRNVSR